MDRANAHDSVIYRGDPVPGAEVRVYENRDTGSPIAQTMYDAPSGGNVLAWPLTTDTNGLWSFYVNTPQQVTLVISYPGMETVTVDDVHVLAPADESATDDEVATAVSGLVSSSSLASTLTSYLTIAAAASAYLTSAAAAATYATIASLSSYLTTATAASTYIAKSVLTAAGDLMVRDGSGPARLAKGLTRQILAMKSDASAPEWFTPPFVSLWHSTTQTVPTGTLYDILFDTEVEDPTGMHAGTNTDRITIVEPGLYHISGGATFAGNATGDRAIRITPGLYHISGGATFAGNATGDRAIRITLNNTPVRFQWGDANGTNPCGLTIAADIRCVANDVIRLGVYQTSGGDLTLNRTANYTPVLTARWVGP